MATSNELKFQSNWAGRLAQLQALGLDTSRAEQVRAQDWNRVQAGFGPYSGLEAMVQLQAAYHDDPRAQQLGFGQQQINPPSNVGHGLLGGLGAAIHNIPADVGDMVRNIPKTLVGMATTPVKDLTHIGEVPGDFGKALSAAVSGDFGEALRTLDATPGMHSWMPLLSEMIPIVGPELAAAELATGPAALMTTGQGRQELEQHPIGEGLLQVVPFGKFLEAGSGVLGRIGGIDAEEVAQKAADWKASKVAGTALADQVNPLSPMERVYDAMSRGKTLATAYRTIGGLSSKVLPEAMDDWAGRVARDYLKRLKLDDYNLSVQRGFAQITRQVDRQRNEFLKQAEVFFKDKSPEEVQDFFRKASDPQSYPNMTPEEKNLFNHAKSLEKMLRDRGKAEGTLFAARLDDNNEVVFPGLTRESPARKLWDVVTRRQKGFEKAREDFYESSQKIEKERDRLEKLIAREKANVDYWGNTQTREKVIKPSPIAPGVTDPGKWSRMEDSPNWFTSESGRSILRAEQGLYVLFDEQNQILGQFKSLPEAKLAAQRMKAPGRGASEFDLVKAGAWQVPEDYRGVGRERQELGPYTLTRLHKGRWDLRHNGNLLGTFKNEDLAKSFVQVHAAGEATETSRTPREPREPTQAELARRAHAEALERAESQYKQASAQHAQMQAELAAHRENFAETDWSQASPRDLPLRLLKPGMAIYESTRDRVYAGTRPRTIITRVEKSGTDFEVWGYTEGERGTHLIKTGHANEKVPVHVPREMLRDVPQPIQVQGPSEAELRRIAATPRTEAMTTAEDVLNEVRNSGLVTESGPPGYDAIHTTVDGEPAHIFTYRNQQGELVGTLNFAQDATGRVKDIMVGVDPRHQRQGIASELYRRAQAAGFDVEASSGQNLTPEGAAFALGRRARAGSQVDWSQVETKYETTKGLKVGDAIVYPGEAEPRPRVIASIRSSNTGKYVTFEGEPDKEIWLGGHASKRHIKRRPEATKVKGDEHHSTQIIDRPRNADYTIPPEEMRQRVSEAAMQATLLELRLQELKSRGPSAENFPGLIHQAPMSEIQIGDRVPSQGEWATVTRVERKGGEGNDPTTGKPLGTVTIHLDNGRVWEDFPADMKEQVARHLANTPDTVEVRGDHLRAVEDKVERPMDKARIVKNEDGTYQVYRWTGSDGDWKTVNKAEWQAAMRQAYDQYGHDAFGFAAENPEIRAKGIEEEPAPEQARAPRRTMTPIPELPAAQRKLMGDSARRFDAAQRRLAKAREDLRNVAQRPSHLKAADAFMQAKRLNEEANQQFLKYFLGNAPAQFQPMLEKELESRAKLKLQQKHQAGEITAPQLDQALEYIRRGDGGAYFTDKEWADLKADVQRGWIGLVGAGYDPLWVHTVSLSRFNQAYGTNLFSDRLWTPTQFKGKIFDLTPRVESVGVALSSASFEFARQAAVREAIEKFILPAAVNTQGMRDNLEASFQARKARMGKKGTSPYETDALIWDDLIHENYVLFDPERFGLKRPTNRAPRSGQEGSARASDRIDGLERFQRGEDIWVPKHVQKAFEDAARPHESSPIGKAGAKVTGVMKASLFFLSPRHFMHVVVGGAMGMMLTGDWHEVASITQAYKMMKNGEMPPEMSQGLDVMSTDQIMHMAIGKWAGSRLAKMQGALGRFEEMMNNWERCVALLGEEKRGKAKGYTDAHARELAIEHVHKTFVDWDGMTTFERTAIRQWLPFYGFTKYIVRFLLSFPADHPVRAAVMAHIAENENKDWNTGLPVTLQKLFFIGSPDKFGNVKVSDIKAINPFRDAANIFSGWGLIGGLNPVASEILKGMGLDTFGGTPELYPQLDIDPNSGAIVGKRPGISPASVAEQVIPALGGVDDFFGITKRARQLKAQNDGAYRQNLFSTLGIPLVPYKINVATEQAKEQKDMYLLAQQTVNEAQKTGDTTQLKAQNLVPWKGHLVPGPSLAALFDWYTATYKAPPAEVMPKTRV